jgi:hypothetical protein
MSEDRPVFDLKAGCAQWPAERISAMAASLPASVKDAWLVFAFNARYFPQKWREIDQWFATCRTAEV